MINLESKTFLGMVIAEFDKKKVISHQSLKDDASFQTILNLEYLNHYVRYKYFETESLSDAL